MTGHVDLGDQLHATGLGVGYNATDLILGVVSPLRREKREGLGGKGVALIVGKVKMKVFDLVETAQIHVLVQDV